MWKKIAVVGSVVAVTGLGVGGVASALSGAPAAQATAITGQSAVNPALVGANAAAATDTPVSTTSPAPKKHIKKRAALAKRLLRVSHAQWVTKDAKTGTFVTHDAVRGEITAVTAGSVTIKATDGTTETFLVTGSTKVRVAGSTGTGTTAQLKVGDRAAVLGTGSGPMTATRVIDRGAPGTTTPTHPATTAPTPTPSAAPSTTATPTS